MTHYDKLVDREWDKIDAEGAGNLYIRVEMLKICERIVAIYDAAHKSNRTTAADCSELNQICAAAQQYTADRERERAAREEWRRKRDERNRAVVAANDSENAQ